MTRLIYASRDLYHHLLPSSSARARPLSYRFYPQRTAPVPLRQRVQCDTGRIRGNTDQTERPAPANPHPVHDAGMQRQKAEYALEHSHRLHRFSPLRPLNTHAEYSRCTCQPCVASRFASTSPNTAWRAWPTCSGPVGFADTNSINTRCLPFGVDGFQPNCAFCANICATTVCFACAEMRTLIKPGPATSTDSIRPHARGCACTASASCCASRRAETPHAFACCKATVLARSPCAAILGRSSVMDISVASEDGAECASSRTASVKIASMICVCAGNMPYQYNCLIERLQTEKCARAFFSGLHCVTSRSPYCAYCLRARSLCNLAEKCSKCAWR